MHGLTVGLALNIYADFPRTQKGNYLFGKGIQTSFPFSETRYVKQIKRVEKTCFSLGARYFFNLPRDPDARNNSNEWKSSLSNFTFS